MFCCVAAGEALISGSILSHATLEAQFGLFWSSQSILTESQNKKSKYVFFKSKV